jgi:hypothetical protein
MKGDWSGPLISEVVLVLPLLPDSVRWWLCFERQVPALDGRLAQGRPACLPAAL